MESYVLEKLFILGFFIGVIFTLLFSTNFADLISIRIAIGSGVAFFSSTIIRCSNF